MDEQRWLLHVGLNAAMPAPRRSITSAALAATPLTTRRAYLPLAVRESESGERC